VHKVLLELPLVTWAALERAAESAGLSPVQVIRLWLSERAKENEDPKPLDLHEGQK
jgi:hypothetical protein